MQLLIHNPGARGEGESMEHFSHMHVAIGTLGHEYM